MLLVRCTDKKVDADDLACSLSERLSREFSVSVEDDSDVRKAERRMVWGGSFIPLFFI